MKVLLQDVIDAIEDTSDINRFFYYPNTEEILLYNEDDQSWSPDVGLPSDLDDVDADIIELPTKYERHDYELMQDYTNQVEDDKAYEWLNNSIHGRGAFRMFRATLNRFGLTEDWYKFKEHAYRELAINWCNNWGIEFDDSNVQYDEENEEEYLEPSKQLPDLRVTAINKNNLSNILYMVADKNSYLNKLQGKQSSQDLELAQNEIQSLLKPTTNIFAVSLNGKYLGYAITITDDHTCLLHSIYVRENERKQGIGSMLLEHAETIAKQENKQLVVRTSPNNKLFQSFLTSHNYNTVEYIQMRKG